jgi:hypothetical protein
VKHEFSKKNGAQSRDRTSDTAIFNRMLYQLSYLGFRLSCQGRSSGERRLLYGLGGGLSTQSMAHRRKKCVGPERASSAQETVDVVGQGIAPGLVARKPHVPIDIHMKHAA